MEDFFRVTHEIKLTVPQVDCGTHRVQRVMRVQVGHLGEQAVGQSWPQVQGHRNGAWLKERRWLLRNVFVLSQNHMWHVPEMTGSSTAIRSLLETEVVKAERPQNET